MKKTNPYKVGDRVYWYNSNGEREVEKVEAIKGDFVCVNQPYVEVYWKFYRGRLKPKRKPREFWLAKNPEHPHATLQCYESELVARKATWCGVPATEVIHVREVPNEA